MALKPHCASGPAARARRSPMNSANDSRCRYGFIYPPFRRPDLIRPAVCSGGGSPSTIPGTPELEKSGRGLIAAIAHSVLRPWPANLPLRCGCVSDTPIYDQLRGERINADVPADGTGRQRVGHHGHHRAPAAAPGGPAVTGRPAASGFDPVANQHYSADVEQAVQAALSAARRARFTAGTRAARRPATHARHQAAHPAGSAPAPAEGRSSAARDPAAPFSWFERPA